MTYTLSLGKRGSYTAETIPAISATYCSVRDESGEGASTFPTGTVHEYQGGKLVGYVSYNGNIWRDEEKKRGSLIYCPYDNQPPRIDTPAPKAPVAEIFVPLVDDADWHRFASANRGALLEIYPCLSDAYMAARQGGIQLGGGAAPLVTIRFVDEEG